MAGAAVTDLSAPSFAGAGKRAPGPAIGGA